MKLKRILKTNQAPIKNQGMIFKSHICTTHDGERLLGLENGLDYLRKGRDIGRW